MIHLTEEDFKELKEKMDKVFSLTNKLHKYAKYVTQDKSGRIDQWFYQPENIEGFWDVGDYEDIIDDSDRRIITGKSNDNCINSLIDLSTHIPYLKDGILVSVPLTKGEEEFSADLAEENHPLYDILMEAIEQCMHGKGERHGGCTIPFLEQPWLHYAKLHGRGFLTGQAAKKLEEAASTRDGEAFEHEVLGAIVFAGMSILYERMKHNEN